MLKENVAEETTKFLSHFYHWWHFIWEFVTFTPDSLGSAYGHESLLKDLFAPRGYTKRGCLDELL